MGMTLGGVVGIAIGSCVGGPIYTAAPACGAPPNVGRVLLGLLAHRGWHRGLGGRGNATTGPDGKPRPAGSSMILRHPSRHTMALFPSRGTSAGFVVTPNVAINSRPLASIHQKLHHVPCYIDILLNCLGMFILGIISTFFTLRSYFIKGHLFIYLALAKPALPGQFVLLVSSQSKENS